MSTNGIKYSEVSTFLFFGHPREKKYFWSNSTFFVSDVMLQGMVDGMLIWGGATRVS